MPTIGERIRNLEKDLSLLFRDRGIVLAYLFGSVARDRERPDSDLDLAVLLPRDVPPAAYARIAMGLSWDIVGLTHVDDVDVVVLNDAPPVLAREIVTTGRLLYGTASEDLEFRLLTLKRYMDTEPLRRITRKLLHERIDGLAASLPPGRRPW